MESPCEGKARAAARFATAARKPSATKQRMGIRWISRGGCTIAMTTARNTSATKQRMVIRRRSRWKYLCYGCRKTNFCDKAVHEHSKENKENFCDKEAHGHSKEKPVRKCHCYAGSFRTALAKFTGLTAQLTTRSENVTCVRRSTASMWPVTVCPLICSRRRGRRSWSKR